MKMEAMQRRAKRRQNTRRGIIVAIVAILVLGTGACSSPASHRPPRPRQHVDDSAPRRPRPWPRHITFSPVTASPTRAGVWGKSPVLVVPRGRPPTKPELANLITGTGPGSGGRRHLDRRSTSSPTTPRARSSRRRGPRSPSPSLLEPSGLISGLGGGDAGHEGGRSTRVDPAARRARTAPSARTGIPKNDTLVFIIDLLKLTK